MAKQLNVSLAFTADTSAAKRQIQDLQTTLDKIAKGQSRGSGEFYLTRDLRQASQAAAELQTYIKKATNVNTGTLDLTKFTESIRQSGTSLAEYQAKLSSIGIDGEKAFMQLAQSISMAEVPLKRTSAVLDNFKTTLMNTARWQISSSVLHGFMGAISSAYNYAKDLNESLTNIRIVTGQSTDQMAAFADKANKAAQALSTTTTRYTDAALIYYQQGLSDKEVEERTNTTIKMMNVAGTSAEEASNQMTAIWNNFYDGTKSIEYYADVITKLGAETASSSEEISTGMEKFAAIANTVGLSYEYAASALATVTATTRQSADIVGTAFKTLFARIQDLELGDTLEDGTTLGKYSAALEAVGVNIKDINGEVKAMDTILDELGAKWTEIGKDQQIALAQTVAGTRQYTQLVALMDNWDFFKENLARTGDAEGTLQQQADIYAESWEAASTRVRAAAEQVYSSLLNDDFFISLTNGFEKVISSIGAFIKNIGGVKGVLISIGAIVTRVFGKEITNALQKASYNLQMMTKSGPSKIAEKTKQEALDLVKKSGVDMDNKEGQAMQETYSKIATVQQSYLQNASKMSEVEQEINQRLMARNQLLANEAIKAGQAADAAQSELEHAKMALQLQQEKQMNSASIKDQNNYMAQKQYFEETAAGYARLKELQIEFNSMPMDTKNVEIYNTEILNLAAHYEQLAQSAKRGSPQAETYQILANRIKECAATMDSATQTSKNLDMAIEEGAQQTELAGNAFSEAGQKIGIVESILERYKNGTLDAQEANILFKAALGGANQALDTQNEALGRAQGRTIGLAEGFTKMASIIMNAAMVIQQINGLINIWNDDSTTTGQKVLQTMMTIGMVVPSIMSIISTSSEMASVSITAFGTAIHLSFIEVTLIAAAIGGLIALFASINTDTAEKRLKKLATAAEEVKDSFNKITDEYNTLVDKVSQYQEIQTALAECKKGTDEWYNSVDSLRTATEDLIKLYPELAQAKQTYDADTNSWIIDEEELKNTIANYDQAQKVGSLATGIMDSIFLDTKTTSDVVAIDWKDYIDTLLTDIEPAISSSMRPIWDEMFSAGLFEDENSEDFNKLKTNLVTGILNTIDFEHIGELTETEIYNLIEAAFDPAILEKYNITLEQGDIDIPQFITFLQEGSSIGDNLRNAYNQAIEDLGGEENLIKHITSTIASITDEGKQLASNELLTFSQKILESLAEEVPEIQLTDDFTNKVSTLLYDQLFGDEAQQGILQNIEDSFNNGEQNYEDSFKALKEAGYFKEVEKYTYSDELNQQIIAYQAAQQLLKDFFNTESESELSLLNILKLQAETIADIISSNNSAEELGITKKELSAEAQDIADRYSFAGIDGFLYSEIDEVYNLIKDIEDEGVKQLQTDIDIAKTTLDKYRAKYNNIDALTALSGITNKQIDSVVSLADSFSTGPSGLKGGELFIQSLLDNITPYFSQTAAGENIGEQLLTSILTQIQKGGPNIAESLQNAFNIQGLTFRPEEWSGLIEIINQLQWTADTFIQTSELFTSAYKILNDLEAGDALDADDYESLTITLSELGIAYEDLFAKQADGTYKLIGTKAALKSVNDQLINNLAKEKQILEDNLDIQNKINDSEALKYRTNEALIKADSNLEKSQAISSFDRGDLLALAEAIGYSQDNIRQLANDLFNNVEGAGERYAEFVRLVQEFMGQNVPMDIQNTEDILASTATSIEQLDQLLKDGFISEETHDKWVAYFQDIANEANSSVLKTIESWENLIKFLEQHPELKGSYEHQQVVDQIGQNSILAATDYTQARQKRDIAKAMGTQDWLADAMYDQRTKELAEDAIKAANSVEELEAALKAYNEETGKSAESWAVTTEQWQKLDSAAVKSAKSIKELNAALQTAQSHGSEITFEDVQASLKSMNMDLQDVIKNFDILSKYGLTETKVEILIDGAKDLEEVLNILTTLGQQTKQGVSLGALDQAIEKAKEFNSEAIINREQAQTTAGEKMSMLYFGAQQELDRLTQESFLDPRREAENAAAIKALQDSLTEFGHEVPAALVNTADSIEEVFDVLDHMEGMAPLDMSLIDQERVYELVNTTEELNRLWDSNFQSREAYGAGLQHLAEQYSNAADEAEHYAQALRYLSEEQQELMQQDLGRAVAAGEQAEAYNLDAEELEDIADAFHDMWELAGDVDEALLDSAEAAVDAATRYKRLNNAVEDLADNYDDYIETLDSLKKAGNKIDDAMTTNMKSVRKLRSTIADLLDTSEDFVDLDLLRSLDPKDLYEAADGSTEAVERIRDAFIDLQAEALNIGATSDEIANFKAKMDSLNDGDLILDLNTDPFITKLIQAAGSAGMTAAEIENLLSGLGISLDAVEFLDELAYAEAVAAGAADEIISNLSFDAEPVQAVAEQTATEEEVTVDEQIVPQDRAISGTVLEDGATKPTNIVIRPPSYRKEVNFTPVNSEEVQQQPIVAVRLKNAHKSAGGNIHPSNVGKMSGGAPAKGGGGGGGGGSQRQTKEPKKHKQEEPERYHVIERQLKALAAIQERLNKAEDRMYGKTKISALEHQNKLLRTRMTMMNNYGKEIQSYLEKDRAKLAEYGAIFDDTGELLNYKGIFNSLAEEVTNATNAYNGLVDSWNAGADMDESVFDTAQTAIDDAQEKLDTFKDDLSQYEETLDKWSDYLDERQEINFQIQDNNFEIIQLKLQYALELEEMRLKMINYYYDKLSDNVYKAAEALKYLYDLEGEDQLDLILTELQEYETHFKNMRDLYNETWLDDQASANPKDDITYHGISQADYAQGLHDDYDAIIELLEKFEDIMRMLKTYYADTLKDAINEIAIYTDHMESLTEVLDHYNTLLNLTGQSKAYDKINAVLQGTAKTLENNLIANRNIWEMTKIQKDLQEENWLLYKNSADKDQVEWAWNEYQAALEAEDEAHNAMLDSAEEFAEALRDIYENKVAAAYDALEKTVTRGMGFDLLGDSLQRLSDLNEEWLTKTNQIYETTALIRDINKAVDNSQNEATKQKLRLFSEEIEGLRERDRLSEFELDLAKSKYELLQAQIALEEAQNAKSMVRLRRNNEGNYGYVYTADQDAVGDAEADVLAKENDLYNKKLQAANEYGEKVLQARQELAEKLQEIDEKYAELGEEFQDEYQAEREQAIKEYYDLIETYSYNYNVATCDDARVVADAWIVTYDDIIRSGDEYQDAIVRYNEMVDESWDVMWNDIYDVIDQTVPAVTGDLEDLQWAIDDVTEESRMFKDELGSVSDPGSVIGTLNNLLTEIDNITTAWGKQIPELNEARAKYEALAEEIYNTLAALQALDEFDPTPYEYNYQPEIDSPGSAPSAAPPAAAAAGYPSSAGSSSPGGGNTGNNTQSQNLGGIILDAAGIPRQATQQGIKDIEDGNTANYGAAWNKDTGQKTAESSAPSSTTTTQKTTTTTVNKPGQQKKAPTGAGTYATGGYTGKWDNGSDIDNGKLAFLHQKELVLNETDTENILQAVDTIRNLNASINLRALYSSLSTGFTSNTFDTQKQVLEQQVMITATFPSVTDHNEIEEALNSLVNRASQYANRYRA